MISSRLTAAVGLVLCICLAAVAWPRFVGGAIVAPYGGLLRELARGETVPPSRIADAEASLQVARRWFDNGKLATAYGALKLVSAQRSRSAGDQQDALAESAAALRYGLANMPGQPYAWLQLTQAATALDRRSNEISDLLSMSLRLSPWEHRIVTPRLALALSAWPMLDNSFTAQLPRQFMRAVDTAPLRLAEATRRSFRLREVRQMLAGSPVHLDRFNIVYRSPD